MTKPITINHKDSKTKCRCGSTVLWKYYEFYGYVRAEENGKDKHFCPGQIDSAPSEMGKFFYSTNKSNIEIA